MQSPPDPARLCTVHTSSHRSGTPYARLLISPAARGTRLRSPPYPGVNQKLTRPRNPHHIPPGHRHPATPLPSHPLSPPRNVAKTPPLIPTRRIVPVHHAPLVFSYPAGKPSAPAEPVPTASFLPTRGTHGTRTHTTSSGGTEHPPSRHPLTLYPAVPLLRPALAALPGGKPPPAPARTHPRNPHPLYRSSSSHPPAGLPSYPGVDCPAARHQQRGSARRCRSAAKRPRPVPFSYPGGKPKTHPLRSPRPLLLPPGRPNAAKPPTLYSPPRPPPPNPARSPPACIRHPVSAARPHSSLLPAG